jgi:hypothetical protein
VSVLHANREQVRPKVGPADLAEDPLKLASRATHVLGYLVEGQIEFAVALLNDPFRLGQEFSPPPIRLSPRHPWIVANRA